MILKKLPVGGANFKSCRDIQIQFSRGLIYTVRSLLGKLCLVGSFSSKWNLFPLLIIGDFRIALKICGFYVHYH